VRWSVGILAVVIFCLCAASSASENDQQSKLADHQSVAQAVQPEPSKTAAITATPILPTTNASKGKGTDQSWHYWDAIAPPTWGNWALAIFAALAARIGLRTLAEMNHQSKISETAANAAKDAADAAKDSAESYRKALALQSRPKLRIRQVYLSQRLPLLGADYVITNIGGSPARIVKSFHTLRVQDQPPPILASVLAVDGGSDSIGKVTLQAGERRHVRVFCDKGAPREKPIPSLYLYGLVTYIDDFGIYRETSFCRHYSPLVDTFDRVPNWDREYED